jgi:hypothetical protein
MNGEDLKFLADRASTLEDRTGVRVEQVHDRIVATRRRRTVTALGGAVCLVIALVVSIQVVGGSSNRTSPEPAPSPTSNPAPGAATLPEPGTCWNVPPADALDPDYWFDKSDQVSCTEPHTTETAQAVELTEATIAEASEASDLCWDYVRIYVGVDALSWVPWWWAAYMPSKEEVAHGAAWLRCDVVFPDKWDTIGIRATTVSAAGLADDPPAEFWACLDEPPTTQNQPFVPCDRPHAYEETGTIVFFEGPAEFPSAAELDAAVRSQCRAAVPDGYADVDLTGYWPPSSAWVAGSEIDGVCWMYHADGTPMPPR